MSRGWAGFISSPDGTHTREAPVARVDWRPELAATFGRTRVPIGTWITCAPTLN
jgi:hypothetical protein